MRKIAVVGSPGSGKSTLARQLGEILDIPVFHLDLLFWSPGWRPSSQDEFACAQQNIISAHKRWIIDGNYSSTLPLRMKACDTLVFLDLPRNLCVRRVIMRSLRGRFAGRRPDMPPGCPERLDRDYLRFLMHVWRFPHGGRFRIFELIGTYCREDHVHRIANLEQLEDFISACRGRAR